MLKLIRNINESVLIYTREGVIEITICDINNHQVRVGFDAPSNVHIVRAEVKDQPQRLQHTHIH